MRLLSLSSILIALLLPAYGSTAGRFLVAEPGLKGSRFERTVVLMVRHDAQGALGLVVNRPLSVEAAELLPEIEGLATAGRTLHWGGPVGERGITLLLRSDEAVEGSDAVLDDVRFGWDGELLRRLAREEGRTFRLFAGYAGWSAGQLEGELERGVWQVIDAESDRVFTEAPEALWRELSASDPSLRASGSSRGVVFFGFAEVPRALGEGEESIVDQAVQPLAELP